MVRPTRDHSRHRHSSQDHWDTIKHAFSMFFTAIKHGVYWPTRARARSIYITMKRKRSNAHDVRVISTRSRTLVPTQNQEVSLKQSWTARLELRRNLQLTIYYTVRYARYFLYLTRLFVKYFFEKVFFTATAKRNVTQEITIRHKCRKVVLHISFARKVTYRFSYIFRNRTW